MFLRFALVKAEQRRSSELVPVLKPCERRHSQCNQATRDETDAWSHIPFASWGNQRNNDDENNEDDDDDDPNNDSHDDDNDDNDNNVEAKRDDDNRAVRNWPCAR
jgi:hypothetical protein